MTSETEYGKLVEQTNYNLNNAIMLSCKGLPGIEVQSFIDSRFSHTKFKPNIYKIWVSKHSGFNKSWEVTNKLLSDIEKYMPLVTVQTRHDEYTTELTIWGDQICYALKMEDKHKWENKLSINPNNAMSHSKNYVITIMDYEKLEIEHRFTQRGEYPLQAIYNTLFRNLMPNNNMHTKIAFELDMECLPKDPPFKTWIGKIVIRRQENGFTILEISNRKSIEVREID